jgi:uncharacterized protein (DUF924 family)
MSSDARIAETLDYWFGPSWDDPTRTSDRSDLWWGGREHDPMIQDRFGAEVAAAERGELDEWAATPEGALALVITVDQFRRNVFRGQPEAFGDDARALAICLRAQDEAWDHELPPVPRVFLYMPMQHAEDIGVQDRAVRVFQALADEQPEAVRSTFQGFADYAVTHRDLIARFGRFPHRNRILGRAPTPEETAYLAGGGATFGQ